jgi:hypothetical protein
MNSKAPLPSWLLVTLVESKTGVPKEKELPELRNFADVGWLPDESRTR